MNKSETLRRFNLDRYLILSLGFTANEVATLRRISFTLRRWHELECGIDGGCIERDDKTGKPYWVSEFGARWGMTARARRPIADRERGALKRLGRIIGNRNTRVWAASPAPAVREVAVTPYIQTDPRGAALYLMRPGDLLDGHDVQSCYTRGICVY